MSDLIENPVVKNLEGLLDRTTKFRIPIFQRDYSWTKDEIYAFLDDIFEMVEQGEEHFFGTIVLSKNSPEENAVNDSNVRYVIDGQQRLTTSLLFLTVLRHQFEELTAFSPTLHARVAKLDEYLHFGDEDDAVDVQIPRLFANRANQAFLQALLTHRTRTVHDVTTAFRSLTREDRSNSKPMYSAYQLIQKYIFDRAKEQLGKEYAGEDFRLIELINDDSECNAVVANLRKAERALREKSAFVEITVRKWQDAFALFDGLNNRGLDLAKRDIVKNIVFARAAGRQSQPEVLTVLLGKWKELEGLLTAGEFTKFLRHYLLLFEKSVMLKDVVRRFLEKSGTQTAEQLLDDLIRAARAYNRILKPDREDNQTIKVHLKNLKTLGAERVYPIILACQLADIADSQHCQVLQALETLYFRRSVICQMDNKELEPKIQAVAHNLYQHGGVRIAESLGAIYSWCPSDDVFVTLFKVRHGIDAGIARYMLLRMENSLRSGHPIESTTLEHILPQDPTRWGLSNTDEDVERQIESLGNLTILTNSDNARIQNSEFSEKKPVYVEENLKINSTVVTKLVWGKDEIRERQSKLSEYIVGLWPRIEA